MTEYNGYGTLLELIGRPWTIKVIDALSRGPMRFGDLKAAVPGISATVLSARLKQLQSAWLVCRSCNRGTGSGFVYELTEWGNDGKSALAAISAWASARSARASMEDDRCVRSQDRQT